MLSFDVTIKYLEPLNIQFNENKFQGLLKRTGLISCGDAQKLAKKIKFNEDGQIPDDFFFKDNFSNYEPNGTVLFIVSDRIQGNWFVRRNNLSEETGEFVDPNGKTILALSLDMMKSIAADMDEPVEKVAALSVVVSLITSEYLKRGGNYYKLYNFEGVECCVFNFCEDKTILKRSFRASRMGYRALSELKEVGFTDDEIESFQKSLLRVKNNFLENVEKFAKDHPFKLNLVSLIVGAVIGKIL